MSLLFDVSATSDGGGRRGELTLPHGKVQTPVFMPVGTAATVKAVPPDQIRGQFAPCQGDPGAHRVRSGQLFVGQGLPRRTRVIGRASPALRLLPSQKQLFPRMSQMS